VGELAFRELSVSLARGGEEYTSVATGNRSVEASTDATEKLDADAGSDQETELTRGLDIDFILQTLQKNQG
jgi:hypothetical protein